MSKLGIHINTARLKDVLIPWAARARPSVAVVLDGAMSVELLQGLKAAGTFVVGRVYVEKQSDWSASQFYKKKLAPKVSEYGQWVDAWIGKNEVGCDDEYAAWEKKRVELLASDGARAVVGNFGAGSPGNFNDWQAFLPAIEAALANNGLLGVHCYQLPMQWGTGRLQWNWAAGRPWNEDEEGAPDEKDTGWWTLRYRKVYRDVLPAELQSIPLVITECGVDGGLPPRPGPAAGGWRDKETIKWWTSQGHADAEAYYLEQLAWYDGELQKDDFVKSAAIYCVSAGDDWASFELEGSMLAKLGDYMAASDNGQGDVGEMIDYRQEYAARVRQPQARPLDVVDGICIHHAAVDSLTVDALLNYFATNGLGYHVYITKDGQAYQCAGWDRVMYHNAGGGDSGLGYSLCNRKQIGVCFEGLLTDGKQPTPEQFAAAREVVAQVWRDLGREVALWYHKDWKATACPGDWAQPHQIDSRLLPLSAPGDAEQLRARVAELEARVADLEAALDSKRGALTNISVIAAREAAL